MKRTVFLVAGMAIVLALTASSTFALTPMWELEANISHPEAIRVMTPTGDDTYWYVVYSVKNTSDEPKQIQPMLSMASNIGKTYNDIYEPTVIGAVKAREGADLVSVSTAAGELKPGETRRGVAVFDKVDSATKDLVLWAYGLAGKRVESRGDDVGIFTRAYKMAWTIPGDQYNFLPNRLELVSKGYVSTFRTQDGKTTEETITVVPVEDEVKAAKDAEAAALKKQKETTDKEKAAREAEAAAEKAAAPVVEAAPPEAPEDEAVNP